MGHIPCRTAITDTLVEEGKKNKDLFVVIPMPVAV